MNCVFLLLLVNLPVLLAQQPTLPPPVPLPDEEEKEPHPHPKITGKMNLTVNGETYEVPGEYFQFISQLFGMELDLVKDQKLTSEDAVAVFKESDTAQPRGLDAAELAASPLVEWENKLEVDDAGLVTEWETKDLFKDFDLNGDGGATLKEVVVFKFADP